MPLVPIVESFKAFNLSVVMLSDSIERNDGLFTHN